ncbi:MAG TPA: tRNA lysidine(34) synthetase TilS [Thermodesulfobacteriota bacterium]
MAAGLLARVERAVREGQLLAAGERCLVAVSGGPDSVALLDFLAALAPRLGVGLVVGHVDHGLRGAEGREAALLVARLAAERGLPYREARLPPLPPGAPMPGEATLRRARYAALARLARGAGCGVVAVAHTRDDQAETVLLRLLRGTGLKGLGGMAPSRSLPDPDGGPPLRLIRPLLDVARADLAARVAERGLPTHPDPTNTDRRWLRNALRLDLMPPLRERVNARLDEALAATAAIARDEEAVLAELAEAAYGRVLLAAEPQAVRLSATGLAALPVALQRRVLRLAGSRAAPEAPAPSFAQVEAARRLLAGRRAAGRGRSVGGPVRWPGRVAVSLERGVLEVAGRVPARTGRARPGPDRAAGTGP